ncbi:hypothetical protein GCM10009676_22280 [Prauserella halophila]|uniref:Uncharacterized protein n=1 Tax=Prauserella halophila TaxID=185641 RepID=A0ABP4GT98_9PSEU|nr:hypothetical protein [Prauserella halophila]MCP2235579.1 hypothetical protein [Prauserella halophila]
MPLPYWTPDNVLPPGRHPADLSDLYERFVWDTPHRNEREVLFSALSGYLGVVGGLIPTGRAWISGEIAVRSENVPRDIDVLLIPDEWGSLKRLTGPAREALYGMLTLNGVIAEQPAMYLDRVRPMSGLLDGFLCRPGDEETWEPTWARGPVHGMFKGFAEVTW